MADKHAEAYGEADVPIPMTGNKPIDFNTAPEDLALACL